MVSLVFFLTMEKHVRTLFIIVARQKNTNWQKKRTGNGKKVAALNNQNLRVLQVLGETPAYAEIRRHDDDSPIQVSAQNAMGTNENAAQCHRFMLAKTPEVTQAINTCKPHC